MLLAQYIFVLVALLLIFFLVLFFRRFYFPRQTGNFQKIPPSRPLLLFDFDGTLADTLSLGVSVFNDIARESGQTLVSEADLVTLRNSGLRVLLQEKRLSPWRVMGLAHGIQQGMASRCGEIELFAGVRESLLELQQDGIIMGIVTSNSNRNIAAVLNRYKIAHCFRFTVSSVSIFGKASALQRVTRKLAVPGQHALYFGDERRDAEACRAAGIEFAGVNWGYQDMTGCSRVLYSGEEISTLAKRFVADFCSSCS